ncbi:MAG TPA: cytochrome bc complex cytochrome b subunit [Gammaproteobacteria bacterium]|nr:cytochrome bc complex cytochrome b subunit [Gammaproteobacteria bacterium]
MASSNHGFMHWLDERFPLTETWETHVSKYFSPDNFNIWYYFGSLAMLVLVIQLVSGIFLTMHYIPSAAEAFDSVEHIMRDVNWGWLIRYMHSTGASAFFIVIYIHMFRGLMYGSFKPPRELVWIIGMLIYLALMAEAFMGYLLPWGQMSYWGAQVIVNLFSTIPIIGDELALWIRGDYVVSDATLSRFFALHVALIPLVLVGLVIAHISALHKVGSNNPEGIELKKDKDKDIVPAGSVPFHPYYTVKDTFGAVAFLIVFCAVMFFAPTMGGYFLEANNFIPADPLVTPEHIAPVWYFTPFYSILRAVPSVPTPFPGVVAMGTAVLVFFFMPWIDRNPIKSVRYRSPLHKVNLIAFVVAFIVLGYLGTLPATPALSEWATRFAEIYFLFFFVLWIYSRPRSAVYHIAWFIVLLGAITLYDLMRYNPDTAGLIATRWFVPAAYLVVMLILPLFTRLGQDRQVPEQLKAASVRHV